MSKKRKTKKEKMNARIITPVNNSNTTPIYSIVSASQSKNTSIQTVTPISSRDYSYVLRDTRKTLFITLLLIFLSFSFYFVLHSNILNIHFLGY
ncbi:MAG: hypothetical protein KBC00_03440 [Candidatus Levybacteria bacterium]|nr:hypothetical protein [Candidatus Levybacteria bacterium]MBP9815289.1 hypothetical protein [Candidatus Levybacteria bacterium]